MAEEQDSKPYDLNGPTLVFAKRVRAFVKWALLFFCILGFGLSLVGCIAPAAPGPSVEEDIMAVYAAGVRRLEPKDCGRCHTKIYDLIKTKGGKHRIDCQQCHVEFHVYRPGKIPYEDVLPKCEDCHEQVHGADMAKCSGCHSEAHAPLNIPADRFLEEGCSTCHSEADKEMKTYVTQHTELYCFTCHHTRHGYIPKCVECHQPHSEEMTPAECIVCHPPHKALQVVYPENITPETCAVCHRDDYETLKESNTKHTALDCAKCHPEHRTIIRCRECHPDPHDPATLQKFTVCGRCHGVAHSLLQ